MADLAALSTEELLAMFQRSTDPNAKYRAMSKPEKIDPTADMSGFDKFAAGAGKAVSDMGLGIRQITGNASQQEVDDRRALDTPLMDTGAGMAGNIGGQVAMAVLPGLGAAGAGKAIGMPALQAAGKFALASPATLGGAVTQGGMGALQSGLQPVATGESRLQNAAIGGVAGAAVPMAGMALKAPGAILEPTYQSGREAILGRTLRRVAGDQADTVAQNLRSAAELVPGSMPTAGQAGGNAGLAGMERAAFAAEPTVTNAVSDRLAAQNAARVSALRAMAGEGGAADTAVAAREAAAGPLYKQALAQGVDPEMAQVLQPQIKNLMERMPSGVMERAKELARVNGETLGAEGSVNGLHYVKLAIDDALSSGKQTGIGAQTTKALSQFKNDLLTVMDDLSPAYGQARTTYAGLSKPVNQFQTAAEIASKSIRPLDESLTPAAYARALNDTAAQRATGFGKATLENTFEPHQLSTLNAIKEDLARSEFARNAGRGAGSDTVQKLAFNNLMQQSGLSSMPNLLSRPVQLAEYLGRSVYGSADRDMRRMLAEALLDPKKTAELMGKGLPNPNAEKAALLLRSTLTPAAIGTTPAMLDAR
jgi:hypothetical protein